MKVFMSRLAFLMDKCLIMCPSSNDSVASKTESNFETFICGTLKDFPVSLSLATKIKIASPIGFQELLSV